MPRKLDATDRALIAMLTENTGRALCDSGDAYGRNWQRNQGLDFFARPATTLKISKWGDSAEISVTHDVFHWLRDRLAYEPHLTAQFRRFAKRKENEDEYWLAIMDAWAKKHGTETGTVNTYNGEDLLYDDGSFILLQIHGGCDVRGGYTAPRIFRENDDYAMFDNARATIFEAPTADPRQLELIEKRGYDNRYWSTDDGCHWYRDGCGALAQLETYDISDDATLRGNGRIVIDGNKFYGPISGGELSAGF